MVNQPEPIKLVTTIEERCRMCFTCVRECPAKAIRVADGQARVVPARCIGCGNCVRVCSQGAKRVHSGIQSVANLLTDNKPVAAIVAPSFPVEFTDASPEQVVGMIRALGFKYVLEVGAGADLVAQAYGKLLRENPDKRYIATSCPAVVGYVERYQPEMVPYLAPIVSPMVATARLVRQMHGDDVRVVFIGPCIAKKGEAASPRVEGEVDAVLTFAELSLLMRLREIQPARVKARDFDPPYAGRGGLLPITRGILQAAGIEEDLAAGDVVAADGSGFLGALREFQSGELDARLLEVLCCEGCIMGAGLTTHEPHFSRRLRVGRYVRRRHESHPEGPFALQDESLQALDMGRKFSSNDQRIPVPDEHEIRRLLAEMGKNDIQDELNCGACGYESCRAHAIAIYKGLAENTMCLPFVIEKLRDTVNQLGESNAELATTREALMHSEKLASMGQLAAGIAHEVNNPLGVVLMYAHLLLDQHSENMEMSEDLQLIADEASRCKTIVGGLLDFARQNKILLKQVDLRRLVNNAMKSLRPPAGVTVAVHDALDDPTCELDVDQVSQVLTNLVSNAFAAMPEGGALTVRLSGNPTHVKLVVSDTGTGIPEAVRAKIFEPFVTTKQIGLGTGLGLAVVYGIVKMHRGDIRVDSNADAEKGPTGTTFTVTLPRQGQVEPVGMIEGLLGASGE